MPDTLEHTWDGLLVSPEHPYRAAVVAFRRSDTEHVYLHRKHQGPDFAGDWAWGAPSGSRLPGEPIGQCASRELREEIGLVLPRTPTALGDGNWHVYHAEVPADADIVLSTGHDRFVWLPAAAAAALRLPTLVGDQILAVARLLGDPGPATQHSR